jgi:Domain of unknown function (DUF4129)
MPFLQGAATQVRQKWSAPDVHDTVAAIARQAAYERSIGQSALQRIYTWLGHVIQAIVDFFKGSKTGQHVTIAIVAVVVAAILVRFILEALSARNDVVTADTHPARVRAADAWRDAERLAAEGRYTDASHALLAALLSAFAQRGEVRLHASKTAGDYARELARRGSPARAAFQLFRRRYDAAIFGAGTCNADEYAALLRDAAPILARSGVSP